MKNININENFINFNIVRHPLWTDRILSDFLFIDPVKQDIYYLSCRWGVGDGINIKAPIII